MLAIFLFLLASLPISGAATASTIGDADASLAIADLQAALDLRQGCELRCDEFASDSLLAARGATRAVDPNKLHHIFGDASHKLGSLVQKCGSQEATFTAVEAATQAAVRSQGLTGLFEATVSVAVQNVVVRGNVMDGVARIGTFFIP